MTVLFVYGTLKRGERNHRLIGDQVFLGEAETARGFAAADLGEHPGLVERPDAAPVRGELWRVDGCCLADLDEFEEVPDHFVRKVIPVLAFEGPVEAYFYNRPVPAGATLADRWPS